MNNVKLQKVFKVFIKLASVFIITCLLESILLVSVKIFFPEFLRVNLLEQEQWQYVGDKGSIFVEKKPVTVPVDYPSTSSRGLPSEIRITRPCAAALRGSYVLPLPFPVLKLESEGCDGLVSFYVSYRNLLVDSVIFLICLFSSYYISHFLYFCFLKIKNVVKNFVYVEVK